MAWDYAGQPFGQIEIYRPAGEQAVFGSAIGEVTRRAGSTRDRARAIGVVPTKFGLVQLVGFAALHGGEARNCMGFAAPFETPRLQISGWFCQSGATAPTPKLVICALDRLTLLASGNDQQGRRTVRPGRIKARVLPSPCAVRDRRLGGDPGRAGPARLALIFLKILTVKPNRPWRVIVRGVTQLRLSRLPPARKSTVKSVYY